MSDFTKSVSSWGILVTTLKVNEQTDFKQVDVSLVISVLMGGSTSMLENLVLKPARQSQTLHKNNSLKMSPLRGPSSAAPP